MPPTEPLPPTPSEPAPPRSRIFVVLLWLAVIGGLAAMPMVWPADGQERSTLLLFFGRFHPLFLHFPIALIALVPVMEVAGWSSRGKHLQTAAGFVLVLGAVTSIIASVLGWLLAWSGGYSGDLVNEHMWAGCTLSMASLLAVLLRKIWVRRGWWSLGMFYPVVLVGTVGLMTWAAHQGGQLTHGERYLEEHMPAPLRSWLGLPPATPKKKPAPPVPAAAGTAVESPAAVQPGAAAVEGSDVSFFHDRIMPAFDRTCVSCHNPNKVKGGLRMDSYAELMKGGDSGPAIEPGKPELSELYRRITLPHDDEEFMPSSGKKPLSEEETRLIELWIKSGASETSPLSEVGLKPSVPVAKDAAAAVETTGAAPDYREQLPAMQAWEKAWGLRLVPVSQEATDGLILRTASAPGKCTDAALAALGPLAGLIVDAELARTSISDTGLAALAACENLRRLDVTQTAITSRGVAALGGLSRLELLNVTATGVDEAGLTDFRARPALRVYAAHLPP